jgi:hypothetical protein
MQRPIETDKTYRVKDSKTGGYRLWKVLEIGKSGLTIKDLATNSQFKIGKPDFQKRLDAGDIYVSANNDDYPGKNISDADKEKTIKAYQSWTGGFAPWEDDQLKVWEKHNAGQFHKNVAEEMEWLEDLVSVNPEAPDVKKWFGMEIK